MQIGELSHKIGAKYRDVRYVLEQGLLPAGVEVSPGRGEHRQLEPKQAFWLALVLLLKRNGLRTPLAGKIAEDLRLALRGVAANLGWDHNFHPFLGKFDTEFTWFGEIGELKYVRLVTNSNPSKRGILSEFPWWEIGHRKTAEVHPLVVIRVDLGQLAQSIKKWDRKCD